MTPALDGVYAATIDRIEDGLAVFLIEKDDETIDEQRIPVESLSIDATEGDRCRITFDDGRLLDIESRPDETVERRRRLRERFENLSRRLGDE